MNDIVDDIVNVEINFFELDEYGDTNLVGETLTIPAEMSYSQAYEMISPYAQDVDNNFPNPHGRDFQIFEETLVVYLNVEDSNGWIIEHIKESIEEIEEENNQQ